MEHEDNDLMRNLTESGQNQYNMGFTKKSNQSSMDNEGSLKESSNPSQKMSLNSSGNKKN